MPQVSSDNRPERKILVARETSLLTIALWQCVFSHALNNGYAWRSNERKLLRARKCKFNRTFFNGQRILLLKKICFPIFSIFCVNKFG